MSKYHRIIRGSLTCLARRPKLIPLSAICPLHAQSPYTLRCFSSPVSSPSTPSAPLFTNASDTIYALSTAPGRAGIAVIRISGPSCLDIYKSLCPSSPPPKPRHATVRTLYEPSTANIVDSQSLVLYFPSPNTVTGEDVLEFHVHGGSATIKAVLAAISSSSSSTSSSSSSSRIRYAEPGEFTKRAFINSRLDLAQVESLSDTLAAETEQQRRAAVRGNSGALGKTYETWREQLLQARGEIEALIDFSEDQHFDEPQSELLENVAAQVERILASIALHETGSQKSELLRGGIKIALVGPPNTGKSSLMNLIVGREASIVSGEAGTTRDIVEASLDIRGYLCSFADTAGFRSSGTGEIGVVEMEGIRRARDRAREADIVVVLASVEIDSTGPYINYDAETLALASAASNLIIVNKHDAVDADTYTSLITDFTTTLKEANLATPLSISCKEATSSGGGIQSVIEALHTKFAEMTELPVDLQDLLGVTERQRQLLVKCRGHLEEFMLEAQPEGDMDADTVLAAEYLRYAADCLARITGRGEVGDVEEVLGVVFEKFCVGK